MGSLKNPDIKLLSGLQLKPLNFLSVLLDFREYLLCIYIFIFFTLSAILLPSRSSNARILQADLPSVYPRP